MSRAAAAAAALLAPASASASSGAHCDRIAAPNGSDSATGTEAAPLRSAQRLVDSLTSGQTGCLRSGSYDQSVTVRQAGITVRPYPGERATLKGRLWIAQGADSVTFEGLKLDGRNSGELPSPTVNADDATFRHNDVTNDHTAICFVVGSSESWGRARRTVIEANRIHHCGVMPAQNHDHGIYVEAADDTRIVGNWIYDNADRGVQLYPDAQRTTVTGNVIDGNGQGVIFSGEGTTSNDNTVEGNVITNSQIRFNIESYYPSGTPLGQRNTATRNCVSNPKRTDAGPGGIDLREGGFTASANVTADPAFSDRAGKDFRLTPGSRCRRVMGSYAEAVPGTEGLGAMRRGRALRISVRPRVVRRGAKTLFTGRADLRRVRKGSRVKVLIKTAGSKRYRTVGSARVKANGRFAIRRRVRPRGRTIRVMAAASSRARSKTLNVRVRR